MKSNRSFRATAILLLLLLLVLAQLACGVNTVQQLASAVPSLQSPKQDAENTSEPGMAPPATQPATILSTPTPIPEPISVVAQGFGQEKQDLGYGFLVKNPNAGIAFESSQFQIAVYNADGAVVKTDSGYIEAILPGQTLGIGGSIYLDEGVTAAKIEVQLNAGNAESTDLTTTFSTEKVAYQPSDYYPIVSGIISNPYSRDFTNLQVFALALDEAGNIIGGGNSYLNFILANGKTAAKVPLKSNGKIAKVELYPSISGLSMLNSDEDIPADAQKIALVKQGFGKKDTQIGYGLVVQNPNNGYAVESSMYHINLYAQDGSVISTEEGYIDLLTPGQTLGIGASIYPDDKNSIATADFQVISGRYEQTKALPFFTSQNIHFLDDPYSPKVTGEILSPYSKDITNVRVSAVAYNANGDIIGGGYTYLDFVPANGKAAAEIPVLCGETPVKIELYGSVTSLSDFDQ